MASPPQFFVGQRVTDPSGADRIVRNVFADGRVELEEAGGPVTEGTRGLTIPARTELPQVGAPPPVRPDIQTGAPLPADQPFSVREELEMPPPDADKIRELGRNVVSFGKAALQEFDPRTPSGQRALAGEAAATIAGATVSGPTVGLLRAGKTVSRLRRIAGITAPIAGAAAGGAGAAGVQSLLGQPPPELAEQLPGEQPGLPESMIAGGLEQGFYEFAGAAVLWPLRFIGKRVIQGRVARNAVSGLEDQRLARFRDIESQARTVREETAAVASRVTQGVQESRRVASRALDQAKDSTRAAVSAAETTSRLGQEEAAERLAASATPGLRGPAGGAVLDVVEGSARTVRRELGDNIEKIAEQGPDLNILALKDQASDIFQREIRAVTEEFSGTVKAELVEEAQVLVTRAMQQGVPESEIAKMTQDFIAAGLSADAAEATIQTARHPAVVVLRKVANAEDTVSFQAAHQFKQELASGIDFGGLARTKTAQLSKAVRNGLSTILDEFEPYREANRAFGSVATLMDDNRVVTALKRNAIDNPESLVDGIKPGDSTPLRMLRDLLTTVPRQVRGEGADVAEAEGRAAWDTVRSAWTEQHIIRQGIEGLGKRLDNLDPEFAAVMYGDEAGSAILKNLRSIDGAFQAAIERGVTRTAAAKTAGAATERGVKRAGEERVETAGGQFGRRQLELADESENIKEVRRLLSRKTAEERALGESSIATARTLENIETDLARSMLLSPGGAWQIISTIRLIKGPRGGDLIRWASHSPESTQLLVSALTSQAPGMAMAALIRTQGFGDFFIDPQTDTSGINQQTQLGRPPGSTLAPTIDPNAGQPRIGAAPPR